MRDRVRTVTMQSVTQANVVASIALLVGSIIPVAAILAFPRGIPAIVAVRAHLLANWREALGIAALYEISSIVRGRPLDITTLAIFAWALVGLALARSVPRFEPLPVVRAVATGQHAIRAVAAMLVLGVVLNVVGNVIGGVGLSIGRALTGEVPGTREIAQTFPTDPVRSFFLLLGGAGIAEETLFRLVALSFFWRLTGNPWIATVAAAVTFGAYHLSPFDGLSDYFWTFPVSQLLAATFIGMLWGVVYLKRGYETAVLGHTLGDWLTILFFAR